MINLANNLSSVDCSVETLICFSDRQDNIRWHLMTETIHICYNEIFLILYWMVLFWTVVKTISRYSRNIEYANFIPVLGNSSIKLKKREHICHYFAYHKFVSFKGESKRKRAVPSCRSQYFTAKLNTWYSAKHQSYLKAIPYLYMT